MTSALPLVSVGLPTYNRADTLRRAIESVLSQDYPNLELIITDNSSSDGTRRMCEEYVQKDNRVIYHRQPNNRGPHENFQCAFAESRGEFFMWLGDDDWLEQRYYVSKCFEFISSNKDCKLVGGRVKYFQDGEACFDEDEMNLTEESGADRVLNYFRRVGMNGIFYGLMRNTSAVELLNEQSFGGDWLFVARLAMRGKVHTLPEVQLNRSIAGASSDVTGHARQLGLSGVASRHAHDYLALRIFKDIAWESSAYISLGNVRRLILGMRSAGAIVARYGLGTQPTKLAASFNELRARVILRTRLKLFLRSLYRGH